MTSNPEVYIEAPAPAYMTPDKADRFATAILDPGEGGAVFL